MQMLHMTKQLFGHKGLNRKPVPFSLAAAAGHRQGLRSDGARSREVALLRLQQLLPKPGAPATHGSTLLLHQLRTADTTLAAIAPGSFEHPH